MGKLWAEDMDMIELGHKAYRVLGGEEAHYSDGTIVYAFATPASDGGVLEKHQTAVALSRDGRELRRVSSEID